MTGVRRRGGIAVLRYANGELRLDHVQLLDAAPTGMVLTHDGTLLVAATGPSITFIDVPRLQSDRGNPVIGSITDHQLGHIYANVTRDDRYLFVANEGSASISVIDLERARANRFSTESIVGQIPMGRAPISVTLSPDERWLYTTSEIAPSALAWPIACHPEPSPGAAPDHPQGAIIVVDVARAERDPSHSAVGVARAGCSPVRLVLSPKGDVAYVSARGDNALLAFDTRALVTDPASARIASVPVGTAPVGVAVVDGGTNILVTSSNRFGASGSGDQTVTVVDANRITEGASALRGAIPAGGFPREMREMPSGKGLILTNFASRTIELIDLTRLATLSARAP